MKMSEDFLLCSQVKWQPNGVHDIVLLQSFDDCSDSFVDMCCLFFGVVVKTILMAAEELCITVLYPFLQLKLQVWEF